MVTRELCVDCGKQISVRADGKLRVHKRFDLRRHHDARCPGSAQPPRGTPRNDQPRKALAADAPRVPCAGCPWRRGSRLAQIPHGERGCEVDYARLEELAESCGSDEFEGSVMGCHRVEVDEVCAGWVGSGAADHSLKLRLAMAHGRVPPRRAFDGIDRSELYESWEEMLDAHRKAEEEEAQP